MFITFASNDSGLISRQASEQSGKICFELLEAHDGLDINSDAHIWLLHHLFLSAINTDAAVWTETWNNHTLARRSQEHRSPAHMYLHGMVQNGIRGVQLVPEEEDIGIDFKNMALTGPILNTLTSARHHDLHNPILNEGVNDNPFVVNHPTRLSHVDLADPRCPFTTEQITYLDSQLQLLPSYHLHDMHSRRLTWIHTLDIAKNILS